MTTKIPSGASLPQVSIGLPVYNGARYLATLLDSLLAQDYADFELIISDNASTDETQQICQDYLSRDPRIRYERQPENFGAAANYNRTVELARAEYFKWTSHDDVYAPTYLGRCFETLRASDRDTILCYPRTILIDAEGRLLREHEDRMHLAEERPSARLRHLMQVWGMCNPIFGLMRLDVLRRTSQIGAFVSSDVVLLAQLALLGKFVEVPEPLFFRRIHAASSRQGTLTQEEVVRWFDPNSRGDSSWLSGRNRVAFLVLETAARAPLPRPERVRAVGLALAAWIVRRVRVRAGAILRRLHLHRNTSS